MNKSFDRVQLPSMKKALLVLFLSSIVVSWAKPAKNLILILADDLGWADTTLYGKTSLYYKAGRGSRMTL